MLPKQSLSFVGSSLGTFAFCTFFFKFIHQQFHIAVSCVHCADPVRDISFDSVKPFYKVGDAITCKANGRPSPSVRWVSVSVNTSHPIEGGLLAVTSNMVARKNIWNCTAWNTIGNVTYTVSKIVTFSASE